ncbi:MAG: pyridoxamine 5'-phosphate oxidase [Deltaproteobacteria bacterium]|nr:pyridoxamine 5'-phosphate oxidase [Deltaproteobacteria bacterium]
MNIESKSDAQGVAPPAPLSEENIPESPFELFEAWLHSASESNLILDHNAMCLSTVDAEGLPDSRIVLLRRFDSSGFVFFTNSHSAKGRELAVRPFAALTFFWDPLRRQIRIRGAVEPVGDSESDAYFANRPRLSQLGAWASQQSAELGSREQFEQELVEVESLFVGQQVPRPPHWKGYRVRPATIEFWQERPNRLHDRFLFRAPDWSRTRLYP